MIRALFALLLLAGAAQAETRHLSLATPLPDLPELVVRGHNPGTAPAILVLRAGDRPVPPPASRPAPA